MKAKPFAIMMGIIIALILLLAFASSCNLKYNGQIMSRKNPYFHITNRAPGCPGFRP